MKLEVRPGEEPHPDASPRADESLASLYSCRFAFLKEGPPKIRPPESEPALRRH